MILTIDIGNTNIHLGLYNGRKLVSHRLIRTQKDLTADSYGLIFKKLLPVKKVDGVIICSVNPSLERQFRALFKKHWKLETIIVKDDLDLGLKLNYENKKLGADRIANVVAAYHLHKKGCMVIDLGTAITFDVVSPAGIYLGGAIAPGIGISSQALFSNTALLKPISLRERKFTIGKTTTESLQVGILYGFTSMLDGMIGRFKKELKFKPLIILTGGEAAKISKLIKSPHILYPFLTLEGLRIIREKNTTNRQH